MPVLPPEPPGCPRAREPRPLPDPEAVHLCLIPDPAPPYDGEIGCVAQASATSPPGDRDHLAPRPREDPESRRGVDPAPRPGMDPAPRPGEDPAAAPAPRPGEDPAAAPGTRTAMREGWPSHFAQVLVETLAGSRPPRQIAPWTTERARQHIQRLGPQLASVQQPRVRRVVTFHPTSDVLEMTVVAGFGIQVRALAVRLERAGSVPACHRRASASSGWLCTAVEAA